MFCNLTYIPVFLTFKPSMLMPRPMQPLALTLKDAIAWTNNWRSVRHKEESMAKAFLFHPDELAVLIKQPGVVQVRFYLGLAPDDNGVLKSKLICVGVNDKGKDMVPPLDPGSSNADEGSVGEIFDFSHPCPDACDESSPLY